MEFFGVVLNEFYIFCFFIIFYFYFIFYLFIFYFIFNFFLFVLFLFFVLIIPQFTMPIDRYGLVSLKHFSATAIAFQCNCCFKQLLLQKLVFVSWPCLSVSLSIICMRMYFFFFLFVCLLV